jgi:hypothetical protein
MNTSELTKYIIRDLQKQLHKAMYLWNPDNLHVEHISPFQWGESSQIKCSEIKGKQW